MSSATLDSSLIWTDVCAKDKLDALRQMSARLCDRGIITDSDIFLEDVLERELAGATGDRAGHRDPHGKSNVVSHDRIAVCVLRHPINWETLDGEPVKVILLFAVNSQQDQANHVHLSMMASVAQALAHEQVVSELCRAATPQDVLHVFERNAPVKEEP